MLSTLNSNNFLVEFSNAINTNFLRKCEQFLYKVLLASERSERDTIRDNKQKSEIYFNIYFNVYIYIWYVPDTLVAQARCYIMWEELSVSHF